MLVYETKFCRSCSSEYASPRSAYRSACSGRPQYRSVNARFASDLAPSSQVPAAFAIRCASTSATLSSGSTWCRLVPMLTSA